MPMPGACCGVGEIGKELQPEGRCTGLVPAWKQLWHVRILRSTTVCTHIAAMRKSVHTPHYKAVREKLAAMRKAAKLTHRQLAKKLSRENSFVWRIEQGERRLDLVEFFWVCRALDQDPAKVYAELCNVFMKAEKRLF